MSAAQAVPAGDALDRLLADREPGPIAATPALVNARACVEQERRELAALTRQRDVCIVLLLALPRELLGAGLVDALEVEARRVFGAR